MAAQTPYNEWLKQDLSAVIEALDLDDLQKRLLQSRWLDQVLWMEGAAARNRARYSVLRLTAIIGGLILSALVNLNVDRWVVTSLSLLVAVSAAVEEFFQCGERWRHYRRTAELLKSEGWHFFHKSGRYQRHETHAQAYPVFVAQVEEIISQKKVEGEGVQTARKKGRSGGTKRNGQ